MAHTPRILISNDDGVHAPGIKALVEVAADFGEVIVVAPNGPQSGTGHAISVGKPLRVYREEMPRGVRGYAINGTPADCVKMATGVIMKHTPDLILSGINHGANSSISSLYSGTLSAAREGAIQGIAAVGFSHCNYLHDSDLSGSKEIVRMVLTEIFSKGIDKGTLLSVNIPNLPISQILGIRLTRQAEGRWVEEFDERVDPYGRKYYWLTGKFALMDDGEDTDEHALSKGYVSVTPMKHDLTDYQHLDRLAGWFAES